MKKILALAVTSLLMISVMMACGNSSEELVVETGNESAEDVATVNLEDGIYMVNFDTDSSMFHVNDVMEGKALMTVESGHATVHLVLTSKNIVNLYLGFAEDAQKDGAELIQPVVEEVTYPDGMVEEVNAFDVLVPVIDEEFDLALIGTKGKWYDHKVSVTNAVPYVESNVADADSEDTVSSDEVADDEVSEITMVNVSLEGGSGKATIESPANVVACDDGYLLTIIWSSPNYDYMIVGDEKYLPINTEGNSTFEIPVATFDEPLNVVADTVAMSKPHEIEYTITFADYK